MKKFDPNYQMLAEMYQDDYYPDFLVDKISALLWVFIKNTKEYNPQKASAKTRKKAWKADK